MIFRQWLQWLRRVINCTSERVKQIRRRNACSSTRVITKREGERASIYKMFPFAKAANHSRCKQVRASCASAIPFYLFNAPIKLVLVPSGTSPFVSVANDSLVYIYIYYLYAVSLRFIDKIIIE